MFASLDKNDDKFLDDNEMNKGTGKIFTKLCAEAASADRVGWEVRTAGTKRSKKDFLHLLDANEDNKLVYDEFK